MAHSTTRIVDDKPASQLAEAYGSSLPWAEPSWYTGRPSPYYEDSHRKLRDYVRAWCDENISPFSEEWVQSGAVDPAIYAKCASAGLLVPIAFGKSIPAQYSNYPIAAGIKPEDWDGFHDFILWDELIRAGPIASIFIGLVVGAPPLQKFASGALQQKIFPEILSGEKRICLAVTEPDAGSDVRNIKTTAEKTADGKHYVVNGSKKWITNGMFSDYFMTLVRTGGAGAGGLSMLLIPRSEGLRTRKLEVVAGPLSATTYVTFEDVKVPAEYLIGAEGEGFKQTMVNFNHERLWIAFQAIRGCRVALEDAFSWAIKREAFDKTLIEQPVVRNKFGNCGRMVESLQAWTEQIVYELENLSDADGARLLGGTTALLKVESGMVCKYVAEECLKIMGGLGLTKTGQGARIEAFYRAVPSYTVPGGSEDVLIDLGVREALKLHKQAQKLKAKI
ncbi:acyl-CoA dehydrogenase-like protein [Boeremia exigua]|uniref:acyl-CoA dehydrogenase-like protein n=1 Tax=Boeremia exigua TaxID=749465 RepID=UPI001E8D9B63|nr:acyl-CoA dehydrogenase-like protein [Boeremia exigua]KAH6639545.1 acyl-CoA dehydrogenase-like protein [Boeremia exigua]